MALLTGAIRTSPLTDVRDESRIRAKLLGGQREGPPARRDPLALSSALPSEESRRLIEPVDGQQTAIAVARDASAGGRSG